MTLVILAAGLGSRYGGLKQIDPVGPNGEFIIDYSIFDAKKAGFNKVVFIIKEENLQDFKDTIGNRVEKHINIEYAFQNIEDLPEGYKVPEGREKPWGTSQALLSAQNVVNENFAVINADDFYGRDSFEKIFSYLKNYVPGNGKKNYAMCGFVLKNTLSDHGHVARGVCKTENGMLVHIDERTKIQRNNGQAQYFEEETGWTDVDENSPVSMNFWGFDPSVFEEIRKREPNFLDNLKNPLKDEYLLPVSVQDLMNDGVCDVTVLHTGSKWYGVTYKEDKAPVVEFIRSQIDTGVYPEKLWD